jgi:hypothetical protein
MSVNLRRNEVARFQKELANLQKKLSDESKKEVTKLKDIDRIERSITKSTSASMLRSKRQQLNRIADDIARIQKNKADISKKISDKNSQLYKSQDALSKEEERERKKLVEAEKKREREQLSRQRAITRELQSQSVISRELETSEVLSQSLTRQHDAFISHASEDKDDFVRPLVEALEASGFDVWYDEFSLKVGDSLRRSIDRGLSNSRYGIVVLSGAFFDKNWPQYELDGLVAKEMEGRKVILPIWHKVSKDEVMRYSLSLADKVAINTSLSTISEIVQQLSEVLKRE